MLPWFPHARRREVADFVRASPLPVTLPLLIPGLERHCFERPDRFGVTTVTCVAALCHYFQQLGHQRLALLGPDDRADPILQAQLTAFDICTRRMGLTAERGLIAPTVAAADQLAAQWQAWRGALAVICYDDTHALRLLTAMHKLGRAAPADFAIVGFNDLEGCRTADPPLTSVCQDFAHVGSALLAHAQGLAAGELRQSGELPRTRLIVRASCGGAGRLTAALARDLETRGLTLATEVRRPATAAPPAAAAAGNAHASTPAATAVATA